MNDSSPQQSPVAGDKMAETLWYTRCPTLTASSIAIRNGWLEPEFAPDGISVLSLTEASDRKVHQSHFSHSLPSSFRHGGNIPPIWARSRGGDVRVIGLSWGETRYGVLALPGSNIRTAADLRGRRLGLPRRIHDSIDFAAAMFLRAYDLALSTAGLSLDDVEIVDLPVSNAFLSDSREAVRGALWDAGQMRGFQRVEVEALLKGEIDAIASSEYWVAELCAAWNATLVFDSHSVEDEALRGNSGNPCVLTVSGNLLDERPDLVVRWLALLLRTERWGSENMDQVLRIAAQEAGVAEAFIERTGLSHLRKCLTLSFDEVAVAGLASQKEFLLRHGFIDRDFDLRSWLAPEFLAKAKEIVSRET